MSGGLRCGGAGGGKGRVGDVGVEVAGVGSRAFVVRGLNLDFGSITPFPSLAVHQYRFSVGLAAFHQTSCFPLVFIEMHRYGFQTSSAACPTASRFRLR